MDQTFKLSKSELLIFAKKLYEEACCGYMDLCESVSENMVADFLDGRVADVGQNLYLPSDPMHGFSSMPTSSTSPASSSGSTSYSNTTFTFTETPINLVRNDVFVREEIPVRVETNNQVAFTTF